MQFINTQLCTYKLEHKYLGTVYFNLLGRVTCLVYLMGHYDYKLFNEEYFLIIERTDCNNIGCAAMR